VALQERLGDRIRDEEDQAKYLAELLEILGAGGVDSTFVLHG
jgi:hypothetical protein